MSPEEAPIDLEMLDTTFGRDGREDIISTFIQHSNLLFSRLTTAFESHDAAVVTDIAHQIKGMGASIYALDLSSRAHNLERLAKSETADWQQIEEALDTLKKCFAKLSGYLDSQN